jgi:hypothetical protein
MIVDLESEKSVDSSKRLGIVSGYSQLRTALGILGLICDLAFQSLHCLYAWRHRGVDKHRNSKIALRELYRDHRQMPTDGLLANCIGGLVALDLDSAPVSEKMEMMGRQLMAKTHALVATGVHARKIVLLNRRRFAALLRSSTRVQIKAGKRGEKLSWQANQLDVAPRFRQGSWFTSPGARTCR